jgi:hypothetical protein
MIIVRCGRAASPNESASVLVKVFGFFFQKEGLSLRCSFLKKRTKKLLLLGIRLGDRA